jgi:hypothetical protein
MFADRVDAVENHVRSFLSGHPDNPITETGITSEITAHGLKSRFGEKRVDWRHQWIDPIVVGRTVDLSGGLVMAGVSALRRRRKS